MKTTKTYLTGCTWCHAIGEVPNPYYNPNVTTSTLKTTCPVCNGAKTVIVTETIEDSQIIASIDSQSQEEYRSKPKPDHHNDIYGPGKDNYGRDKKFFKLSSPNPLIK